MFGRFSSLAPLALIAALAAILAACSAPTYVCPKPYILDQTGTLVRFAAAAAPSPQSLDFQADIEISSMTCEFKDELLTDLEVNMGLKFTAIRGPGNQSGEAEFQYFVAITDVRGNILNKKIFDFDMDLGEVGKPVSKPEKNWQKYRLLRGQSAQAYRVWAGFQMSGRDLDVVRQLRGE